MDIRECYEVLLDKCNKSGTNYSQSLMYHVAMRAINEAQSYWYDLRLKVAETNLTIQRELQKFIKSNKPLLDSVTDNFNTYLLPVDFYHFSQLTVIAKKGNCTLPLDTFFTENFNTQELFLNANFSPDFSWQQTLATVKGNTLVVYKTDFTIDVSFDYFRKLSTVDIESGYIHLDGSPSINIDLELDGSSAYEILTIAAQLITGNITDPVYRVHSNTLKEFK